MKFVNFTMAAAAAIFELPFLLFSLFFLFFSLLPNATNAQNYKNISLGSTLIAGQNANSSWTSPSGEFAIGFQQIGKQQQEENNSFLLSIWFDKIPEKTIVWSANRDHLAPKGSHFEVTTDGRLVLSNPQGKVIWSDDSGSATGVAYAAMLDTGNFVLVRRDVSSSSNNNSYLWESFDHPTDTILPTQTLQPGMKLIARNSETNYSNGRFLLSFQSDGNLVLFTTHFPLERNNFPYWETKELGTGYRVIFNQSGNIYVSAANGSVVADVLSNTATSSSTRDFYQRAILEYDGVMRLYVHPKSTSSSNGRWTMSWTNDKFIPSNICTSISGNTGSGACGFNSYCSLENDQRPRCFCPSRYTYLDSENEMSGCKPDFSPQSCDPDAKEVDNFDFRVMINMNWPTSDYELYEGVTEDWCRGNCLGDCFCAAVVFNGEGQCWKKKFPLSFGRLDYGGSIGSKTLIKVRKDNSTLGYFPGGNPPNGDVKDRTTLILTISVLLGSSVFLNLCLLLATFLIFFYTSRRRKQKVLQSYQVIPGMNLQSFTYEELEKATDGFKEELGRGACGIVYKGVVSSSAALFQNHDFVAVKKLDRRLENNGDEEESDHEFKTEVSAIGRTNHKNLVQLLGFCNQGQHRLLVYEFMSKGSLESYIFGNLRLINWYRRTQIAFGIARGIFYLHEECSVQIIHCDIKPQNILLDDNFNVRISDFGIAKSLKTDQTRTMTKIRGTKGYVAPEWFKSMPITVKVDVYSFGILLLELIFCRKNFMVDVNDENEMILSDWAYDCYKDGRLDMLVENDEEARDDMKKVEKFVMIAIWCIQEDPSLRPTMKKVTQMLEGAIEVPVPPNPSSFISSI